MYYQFLENKSIISGYMTQMNNWTEELDEELVEEKDNKARRRNDRRKTKEALRRMVKDNSFEEHEDVD